MLIKIVIKNKVTYTRREQLRGNIHTNGAYKNSNDNTTPIAIGLNKTTQKTRTSQEEGSARKDKERCVKQMYLNVSDENMTLEYF
jgi:hypothetical protein